MKGEELQNSGIDSGERMMHEGANVRKIRNVLGLKQSVVASKAEMTPQNWSLYEQMPKIPEDKLNLIAKALEVPPKLIRKLNVTAETLSIYFENFQIENSVPYIGNNSGNFSESNNTDAILFIKEMHKQLMEEKDSLIQKLREENAELKKLLK